MACPHPLLSGADGGCPVCPAVDPPAQRVDAGQLRYLTEREARRRRFLDFMGHVSPHLPPPRHLAPIVELWQRTGRERVRAVIAMPPRHAKTHTAIHALAWHVFRDPTRTHVYATFNDDRARSASRKTRALAQRAGVLLAGDMANLHEWRTSSGGGCIFTSVRGHLTGEGVDGVVLVDDSLKDSEEAHSDGKREAVWDWFGSTVWVRQEPSLASDPPSVVVMHTRWHEDDLIGRILRFNGTDGVQFEQYCYPAIAEEGDPLGRAPGEALWPSRFPVSFLEQARAVAGPYNFAALFQQRPAPLEGGMFRKSWFKFFDPSETPKMDDVVVSVDPNVKQTADGSRCCIMAVGRAGANRYVLDVFNKSVDIVEQIAQLHRTVERWPKASRILMEAAATGSPLADLLSREIRGVRMITIPTGKGNKEQRALVAQPVAESGCVLLPRGAPWVEDFLYELCTFPNGKHDDQVDALSQALNYMRGTAGVDRARMLLGLK